MKRTWIVATFLIMSLGLGGCQQHTEVLPQKATTTLPVGTVALYSYQQKHDWLIPWNKKPTERKEGTALVLNRRLLTSAHIVENSNLIEVYKPGKSTPYQATVYVSDPMMNLALLEIEDASFWEGLTPVQWGDAQEGSSSIQYWESPGNRVTEKGNIKTLSMVLNRRSQFYLPVLKVEADLGNAAHGVAICQEDRVVGMGMQSHQSEVYAMPAEFLKRFVAEAQKGEYQGFSQRGFEWERLHQEAIRRYLKLPSEKTGVLVTRIQHYGTGAEHLQLHDFLVSVDGWPLSNEGKVEHPKWGEILLDYVFTLKTPGMEMMLEVVRDGKLLNLQVPTAHVTLNQQSIPWVANSQKPRFVLRGGLLFQELTQNYIEAWKEQWQSPISLRLQIYERLESHLPQNKDRHVVLLTRVLADPINIGYQDLGPLIVSKINQKSIQRLEDVVQAFEDADGDFHQVHFLPSSERISLVLPVISLKAANQQILRKFQIQSLESL